MPALSAPQATEEPFHVGESVLVPLHGPCQVVAITEQEILGKRMLFYVFEADTEEGQIKIPVSRARQDGLRRLLSRDEMEAVLQMPVDQVGTAPEVGRPSERHRHWVSVLRSGGPGAHKQLLLELAALEKRVRLTPQEKLLRERVREDFQAELKVVLGYAPEGVEVELTPPLSGAARSAFGSTQDTSP